MREKNLINDSPVKEQDVTKSKHNNKEDKKHDDNVN